MAIRFHSAGRTDVGLKRAENEDNFLLVPDAGLYILADGMGGHSSGQVASALAVKLIQQFVCEIAQRPDFEWHYEPDPQLSIAANVLSNAVQYANERIFIESCKSSDAEGMGTTVTALLETERRIVLAHVGDSRVYRLRGDQLQLVTRDHSLLNHLLDTGELRPEQAATFERTNVILRAVGLKDYVDVEVREIDKVAGDLFLMCSDGLNDMVHDEVMADALMRARGLMNACDRLIELALDGGGKDNVTAVCVYLEEVSAELPPIAQAAEGHVIRSPNPSPARNAPSRPRPGGHVDAQPMPQQRSAPDLLHAVRQPRGPLPPPPGAAGAAAPAAPAAARQPPSSPDSPRAPGADNPRAVSPSMARSTQPNFTSSSDRWAPPPGVEVEAPAPAASSGSAPAPAASPGSAPASLAPASPPASGSAPGRAPVSAPAPASPVSAARVSAPAVLGAPPGALLRRRPAREGDAAQPARPVSGVSPVGGSRAAGREGPISGSSPIKAASPISGSSPIKAASPVSGSSPIKDAGPAKGARPAATSGAVSGSSPVKISRPISGSSAIRPAASGSSPVKRRGPVSGSSAIKDTPEPDRDAGSSVIKGESSIEIDSAFESRPTTATRSIEIDGAFESRPISGQSVVRDGKNSRDDRDAPPSRPRRRDDKDA